MMRKIKQNQGQAITELAIFGMIMLVIFGVLLRYAIMYNEQQKTQMYAFRKALELAKRRHNGWSVPGASSPDWLTTLLGGFKFHIPDLFGIGFPIPIPFQSRKFAGADVNVQKNVYPVNVFGPLAQESPSMVSGSASVVLENEAANFGTVGTPFPVVTRSDTSGSYYQVGDSMIEQGEFFEPGYIPVVRKVDENGPHHPWDSFYDTLSGVSDDDQPDWYLIMQPIPYREIETNTTVASATQYRTQERADDSAYNQGSVMHAVTKTTYHPPGDNLADLWLQMWLWDPKVILPLAMPESSRMEVTVTQDVTKERTWNSPR